MRAARRSLDTRWAFVAVVLVGVSVLLGGLARRFDTFPLDRRLGAWINGWGDWYEPVATLTNEYDIFLSVAAALAGMLLLARQRSWGAALLFPLAGLLRLALGELKGLVDRLGRWASTCATWW
jgi:hypothetical protein